MIAVGIRNSGARESGIALAGHDVVEHPQLRLLERAVARQAAFDEDALRHAVLRDRADERRQHRVVQRLAIAAPDEVAAEPFEEMIERPDARPLADRVRQRDELEEHVRDEDVVGIRAVVDEVDDDRVLRRAWR